MMLFKWILPVLIKLCRNQILSFIDNISAPIVIWPSNKQNILVLNSAAQDLFNIKQKNVIKQEFFSSLEEECRQLFLKIESNTNYASSKLIGQVNFYNVYQYQFADNKLVMFNISADWMIKQRLAFQQLAKKTTGLTLDYPAENIIQYTMDIIDFYENILALMPEHVYWKDLHGIYLGCNEGVAKSAGLKNRKDIVGKTDWEMVWVAEAERYNNNDKHVIATGESFVSEEAMQKVNGEKVLLLSNKVPLKNSGGKIIGILGISINITKLKETEASLRQAKEEAEEANRAKSEFLAMMTHELRTPLNVIMGMVQIMQKDTCTEEQRQEYFNTIMRSSKSLLGIINDILDFSKAQSGKLQVIPEPFELQSLLGQLYTEFNVKGQQHGTQFIIQKDDRLPNYLVADELRLRQVIYNLCDNAMKFTNQGSVTLYLEQFESKKNGFIGLKVQIIDTGIGIPQDKLETVFEQFTQVSTTKHNEYSRKYGGVGLGLAIVRHLVNLMDGRIKVNSELGKGTTFTCEFEFALPSHEQLDLIKEQSKKRTENLEKALVHRKVLVVEDNLLNQKVVARMLESLNCEVDIANDGSEALAKMQRSYDVVLMDMSLPDLSGVEVTKQFRKNEPRDQHQLIIALSANVHNDDQQKCMQAGMDGFLPKPLMFDELRELIASL